IDEFFAILFSVLIATALTVGATLYLRVYHFYQPEVAPLWEYSQGVIALFVILDVLALNLGRAALRGYLQRMWAAGYNVKRVRNECVDIKVIPDLVQYATIKAALEDLDGIPIISLNEVPLRGWNSMLKRVMDVVLGSGALLFFTFVLPVFPAVVAAIKLKGGKGPVFLRQERMTLDGKT